MPKLEIRNADPLFSTTTVAVQKAASEKAAAWATKLWGMKQTDALSPVLREMGQALADGERISARDCSRLIDTLKNAPYAPKAPKPVAVTEGFYKLGGDYVKVQEAKHGSGHLYAKRWDGSSWQYEPGLVGKLAPTMELTTEQAKQWGDLYGCCIYCSLELTDERSITAGYGPKCAAKRGLPWG